jgi:hypothetical protein
MQHATEIKHLKSQWKWYEVTFLSKKLPISLYSFDYENVVTVHLMCNSHYDLCFVNKDFLVSDM